MATVDADTGETLSTSDALLGSASTDSSATDALAVQVDQSALQSASGMGVAHTQPTARQVATKTAEMASAETLAAGDVVDSWRDFYVAFSDLFVCEEALDSFIAAAGGIGESLAGEDSSTTVAVLWGSVGEGVLALMSPTTTAEMWAASIDVSGVVDSPLGTAIEFYIPDGITVTYGRVEYSATISNNALIEAVAGGKAVAALTAGPYIATRTEV